ncbi:MAG: PD-(D/E)XK nuclease family protein [Bacteroidota bacterium]
MIKKFPFTKILGWSPSRYEAFHYCKRMYYYNYYGKNDTDSTPEKISQLKALTSAPLATGSIVHIMIEFLLKRLQECEKDINIEKFFDFTRKNTDEYCSNNTFMEVYYKETKAVKTDEIYKPVEACLKELLGSQRFGWIFNEAILNKKKWIIEPPGFGETRINELKAYCKVDFLFPMNDQVVILDWKTGKDKGDHFRKQLLAYTCWANYHLGVEAINIQPFVVMLSPTYNEIPFEFGNSDIKFFSVQVKEETEEMYEYCSNVKSNIPKEKSFFAKTKSEKKCAYCNYRELCQK